MGHVKGSERPCLQPSTAPPRPFPRLSCCGSHGLAPARLQGPSISIPPATTAERSPALLAGEIGFPATKAPLAPGDHPSSLVSRPLFSLEQSSLTAIQRLGNRVTSSLTAIQRPENRVTFLCRPAGPCVASAQMAGWGEGAPWRRRSQAGPPQGCPRVQPANPGHALPPTCPDVSNLHRFFVNLLSSGSPEVCPRSLLQICKN